MTSRIAQLEQFAEEDPTDPFNLYALGLEYAKTDEGKAVEIFTRLINDHSTYLPTYYHLAKLYQGLDDQANALHVFDLGIDEAKKQHELKTLRELLAAKQELLFES